MGLCHANIGNVDKPSWICYTAREEPHEPVQLNDGTNQTYKIGMLQSWVPESFVISTITQRAPARMDSFEECLQHCLEISCFAVAYHRLEKSCLFELEPIAFDYRDTSTAQIPVEPNFDVAFFVRPYVEDTEEILPVAELCQDQEDLPADWQYGSALYQPFTEETAATMEECMIKCNPDGECNKRIIFRTEDGACLIFQSKEIFHQESETNSVTPINHSGQQCVIKPVLSGRIRPKSYFWELKENEQLAEPRERHFFSSDTPQLNQERNECWEYCSQIPWCQAAIEFLYQSVGTCQFYDREESIITSQDVQTRNIPEPIAVTGMIGKIFTDENFCHNGGVLGEEFSKHFFTTTEAQCDFLQLCSKTTIIGTCCYVGRETKPQPLIVKGCEMQPFLAPQDIIDVDDEILGNFLMINATSYEECVRSCSWEQHCFGLLYIPSSQECGRIIQPSTATTKGTNFVDALKRNGNSDDEVEVLMAFIIPHCPPCVQRVLMQEQISFKDEIQCTLTSQESCSDVYKTIFKTQEVEECKESFVKNCHIEYEMVPRTEKVEICHSPLTRDCNEEGPETCTTEFETVCDTTYHENEVTDDVANCNTVKEDVCDSDGENCRMVPRQVCQVDTVSSKKLTPEMDCRQEAREVCGPEICPIVQGERICVDELKTFVQEVPQEKCQISPKTVCDKVHKVVPKLEMNQECIDVPQEICQSGQVEANKEKIPIVKEWCHLLKETLLKETQLKRICPGGKLISIIIRRKFIDRRRWLSKASPYSPLLEELAITSADQEDQGHMDQVTLASSSF
ncbi:uncharacterized protein LOC131881833 [Tigriopus californicus]|uniref:uncharacterized protein LOC131881833 n=1 Tax=Tigriopus californicus TaxID=6832 RepID=UPI0027D9F062|nr:uncharacterized protein LOC131881833 [Tigriopus californicus]